MHDTALLIAGAIGSGVALIHGVLMQHMGITPLGKILVTEDRLTIEVKRLIPPLLHFTTFNWFVSGLALIAAVLWLGSEARLVVALLAASSYLYGVFANLWGTRQFHPGWILYAVAVGLITYGITGL